MTVFRDAADAALCAVLCGEIGLDNAADPYAGQGSQYRRVGQSDQKFAFGFNLHMPPSAG